METLYRKVAVSERMPEKIGTYMCMVGSRQLGNYDFLGDKFESSAVKYWFESFPNPTAQLKESLNVKSLEEIRDIVAKNRGYENWEILNGSDLYDSDIDEVARMYSESKTAQLKADKAELLERIEIYKECLELHIDPRVWDEVTEFLSTAKSGPAKELSRK